MDTAIYTSIARAALLGDGYWQANATNAAAVGVAAMSSNQGQNQGQNQNQNPNQHQYQSSNLQYQTQSRYQHPIQSTFAGKTPGMSLFL